MGWCSPPGTWAPSAGGLLTHVSARKAGWAGLRPREGQCLSEGGPWVGADWERAPQGIALRRGGLGLAPKGLLEGVFA